MTDFGEGFSQVGYDIRLEWGAHGVTALSGACGALVVVDVLSFCTRVDLELAAGRRVRPLPWAVAGGQGTPHGVTAIASPNGAALSLRAAAEGITVLAGCLRNAGTVAAAALSLAGDRPVGVIAAGEQWGVDVAASVGETGPLRPCIEDHLGAGAIVEAIIARGGRPAPEAAIAALTYRAAGSRLAELVADSVSGVELRQAGREADVTAACATDHSTVAPLLRDGVFQNAYPQ